jgi:hypothetical protein
MKKQKGDIVFVLLAILALSIVGYTIYMTENCPPPKYSVGDVVSYEEKKAAILYEWCEHRADVGYIHKYRIRPYDTSYTLIVLEDKLKPLNR